MSEKTDFKNTDENSENSENKINKSENLENKDEKKIEKVNLDSVFSKSNLIFLVWFLAIYFIIFFILKLFLKENSGSFIGYTFDLIMLVLLIIILLAWYYSTNANDRDEMATSSLNGIKDFLNEKWSVFVAFIFIVILYIFGYLLGLPMDSSKPISFSILEAVAWGLLIITLFVQFFKYIFVFSLLDEISKLCNKKDED